MDEVFQFAALLLESSHFRLPPAVRLELEMLLDLFPLKYAELRVDTSLRVYASDASESGGDVTYCDLSLPQLRNLVATVEETRGRKVWNTFLQESIPEAEDRPLNTSSRVSRALSRCFDRFSFRTAIAMGWTFNQHINLLEVEVAILAVRHLLRSPVYRLRHVILFLNNSVTLGALSKGRSSSSAVNSGCRHVAAALLRGDIRPVLYWVPSALNPADDTSRAVRREQAVVRTGSHRPRTEHRPPRDPRASRL